MDEREDVGVRVGGVEILNETTEGLPRGDNAQKCDTQDMLVSESTTGISAENQQAMKNVSRLAKFWK